MKNNPVKHTPDFSHHIPFEKALDDFEHEDRYRDQKIKIIITFDE